MVIRLRYWIPPLFPLGDQLADDLLKRLEATGHADVARRIEAAAAADPPRFVVLPADEPVLLAALDAEPEPGSGVLAELRHALREITGQAAPV